MKKKNEKNIMDYDCGSHLCENGCISIKKYDEPCSSPVVRMGYLKAIDDSQFYTDLNMIKNSLERMKEFYTSKDAPEDFTFEHMIKGIENTLGRGLQIK
jgi:hypothetical protein